jgi:pimeloyl-ACP methyl ester carboxylesterase
MVIKLTLIIFILLLGLGLTILNTPSNQTTIALQRCYLEGVEGKTQCGRLEVFENRDAKKGRKISLSFMVLPATGNERSPDPLFYIPGGPGSSATEDVPGIARQFAKIRERRDLVFLDQRGTGNSHPLNCKFFDENDPQSHFGYFFPLEDVKRCREELEKASRPHDVHHFHRDG